MVNFSTYDSDIRKTISRNNNLDICKFDYTGNYNSANERLKKRKSHPLEKVCSAQKHDKQNMTQHTQQLNLPNINGRGNAPAAGAMTQHATDYRLYNIYNIYIYLYIVFTNACLHGLSNTKRTARLVNVMYELEELAR